MKNFLSNPFMAKSLVALMFLCCSCSDDSDLSDYNSSKIDAQAVLSEIKVTAIQNEPLVFNVNSDNAKRLITEVGEPKNGKVIINKDNTFTYTPKSGFTGTDEFNYVAHSTNDGLSSTALTGTISVTVNSEVDYWKSKFDYVWNNQTCSPAPYTGLGTMINRDLATAMSLSSNYNQEYYYLGYYINGLTQMWQASGDKKYLDTVLKLINNTISKAVDVGGGYKGWPNADGKGHSLWDGYYWRYVTALLNVMYRSPSILANSTYKAQYQKFLDFSRKHIWDRYEARGTNNFYRSRTHMAAHWASIGMDLYMITGVLKYKTVFNNISYGNMIWHPSNLRNQLKINPRVPSAYKWTNDWNGSNIQDISHGGSEVSLIVAAHQNGMYWTRQDVNALASTLKDVVWLSKNGGKTYKKVDGSGDFSASGRIHEWLPLGRYNRTIQDRIKSDYTGTHLKYYGVQPLGIAALNARILTNGSPVYPEK